MHLDPSLNMSDHLHKVLKKATARMKLLARMRKLMSVFAAKVVYSAHSVHTPILYCSTPALKISKTMAQKFVALQDKAPKIIYHQIKEDIENEFASFSNQKKLKATCIIFECLHEQVF